MKEQRTWIPVSERLPKPEEEVLVTAVRRYKNMECEYIIAPAIYEDGTVLEWDSTWSWEDIDGEWDEENDCQIIPEGWWENRRYNPECTYNCPIDDEVIVFAALSGIPRAPLNMTENELAEAIGMAVKALEEVRVLQDRFVDVSLRLGEYMEIGTPEECREAVTKQKLSWGD